LGWLDYLSNKECLTPLFAVQNVVLGINVSKFGIQSIFVIFNNYVIEAIAMQQAK